MMTFADACSRQHLYHSFYTVWHVDAGGKREYLGFTSRKSGRGLLSFVAKSQAVRDRLRELWGDGAEAVEWTKKTADAIHMSNGCRVKFGGTIRQEAADAEPAN